MKTKAQKLRIIKVEVVQSSWSYRVSNYRRFFVATGFLLFINDRLADIFAGRCREIACTRTKALQVSLNLSVFQLNRDQSRDEANLGFVALSTLSIERLFCPLPPRTSIVRSLLENCPRQRFPFLRQFHFTTRTFV